MQRRITPDNSTNPPSRRWPLALLVLVTLALGFGLGYLTGGERLLSRAGLHQVKSLLRLSGPQQNLEGQWSRIQTVDDNKGLSASQLKEKRRLLSLGYVGGAMPAPNDIGVTVWDSVRSSGQPRLYVSGHAPTALLMDAGGGILHRWRFRYPEAWRRESKEMVAQTGNDPTTGCWRRARLLPGGDLLAIFEGRELIKLDRESQLVWRYRAHCHHDLDVGADGNIYVLTREAGLVPAINAEHPVLVDYISVLDPDGQPLRRISILESFLHSDYASHLDKMARRGDIMHTNTLELLDGSLAHLAPQFAAGHVLISLRELNLVAIVDLEQEQVVWALSGLWVRQHEPNLTADGTMLVFDNLGHGGRSKAVEIDPFSQRIVWQFADSPGRPLFSPTCGAARRLPGGNTLVVESDAGRAFEVTGDGTIVWEYRNPERTGENNELIAAILDLEILPAETDLGWLDSPAQ